MRGTSVHVTDLAGHNFQSGANVKLTKTGESDIAAANVVVVSEARITCDLNLSTAATGAWNVIVRNPDGEAGTLSNGFTVTPPVPTLDGLPSQLLLVDETRDNAIDLWQYASDPYYATSQLTFTITNSPNANAGVSLDSNRYIDIAPATGWLGQTDVTVRVTNPAAQTDTDTFTVIVTDTLHYVYLPVVQRN